MDRSGLFLVLSYATFLASCSGSLNRQSKQSDVEYDGVIDSIYLTVRAIDLTEDMSSLSSKNDELTVLVYLASYSTDQMRLLFSNSSTVNAQKNTIQMVAVNLGDLSGKKLRMVMIERDTDGDLIELETKVRSQYDDLINHYRTQGNFGIEKYIGDNDVIGIRDVAPVYKGLFMKFDFEGTFKLDRYRYQVNLSAR